DLPPFGFAWVFAGAGAASKSRRKPTPPIAADGFTLQNEHCQVRIHPETGGIQSIYDFRTRGNLLSQQVAIRLPSPPRQSWQRPQAPSYSTMVAESCDIVDNGPVMGAMRARGRLVSPECQTLANFEQTIRLWHGSRTVS